MEPANNWFVILNPKAGNGSALKQWPRIKTELKTNGFNFEFALTQYTHHATSITKKAIKKGFRNIICIGGDGTLHAIVNGLMLQHDVKSSEVRVGVIPIGTGNDWAKTYNIPNTPEMAIQIIKNNITKIQDIGKIEFLDSKRDTIYFNNLAGIGFDGLVSKKVEKLKYFGRFSYLLATCQALFYTKNFNVEIVYNNTKVITKSLMVLVGLCTYSGGGMRLTHAPNPKDGFFDVSNITNFKFWDIITNITKLYNGKVHLAKKVQTFKTKKLIILANTKRPNFYMQADGEVLDAENISVSIIDKAFSFYC